MQAEANDDRGLNFDLTAEEFPAAGRLPLEDARRQFPDPIVSMVEPYRTSRWGENIPITLFGEAEIRR